MRPKQALPADPPCDVERHLVERRADPRRGAVGARACLEATDFGMGAAARPVAAIRRGARALMRGELERIVGRPACQRTSTSRPASRWCDP
jgi:hypothetical protein